MRPKTLIALLALLTAVVPPAAVRAQTPEPTNIQMMLARWYGIQTAPLCYSNKYTVGTTATKVAPLDSAAIATTIINLGTSSCNYAWDGTVTTSSGISLAAGGGASFEGFRDDLVLPSFEHWAVCGAASQTITVVRCDLQ